MFKSVFLQILIVYFCEFRLSYQNKSEYLTSDEIETGLNIHNNVFKELENEEFILTEVDGATEKGIFEGSGNFEGSGEYKENVQDCIEIGFDAICSKKGRCINNKCVCNSMEITENNVTFSYRYSGRFCEECPYCRAQRCQQFLPCIECNLFQKGANCNPYCQFQFEIVDKVTRDVDNDEKFCDIENANGFFFKFKYWYDFENVVAVQYEKEFFSFDGYRLAVFTFWGVIVYIFALTLIVPRICCKDHQMDTAQSRTSLSRRYDILRLHFFRNH